MMKATLAWVDYVSVEKSARSFEFQNHLES